MERLVTLRLSLREGSIYYFADRSLTSPEPHYFIVVNSDPLAQRVLLLSVVTSQVANVKLRRQACPETLVELTPAELSILKKPSIVDGTTSSKWPSPSSTRALCGRKFVASTGT